MQAWIGCWTSELLETETSLKVLIAWLRSQNVEIGFCFHGYHRVAVALIALLKKRKRLFLLANLCETPCSFNQRSVLLKRFGAIPHKSRKPQSLILARDQSRVFGGRDGLPKRDGLLKHALVTKRSLQPKQGHAEFWIHLKSFLCVADGLIVSPSPVQRPDKVRVNNQ